jgi:hypothetical protein
MAKARAKAKAASKAARGRPSTLAEAVTIALMMPKALQDAIDAWAASVSVGRSEAIPRLIEAGLKRPPKVLSGSRG